MRKGLRQFETAEAAQITKAMLSAYENGKRRPSLKTLDQILAALEADLGDLHHSLVTERRERARAALVAEAAQAPSGTPPTHTRPADELGEPPPRYGDSAPPPDPWRELPWRRAPEVDLYRALGIRAPLPPAEERALSEMLVGFLKLLRFLHTGGGNAAGGSSTPAG